LKALCVEASHIHGKAASEISEPRLHFCCKINSLYSCTQLFMQCVRWV
jgi:hypothetical protein